MGKNYHAVAASNEDSDSSSVGALLNNKHLFPGGAKCHLPDNTGLPELLSLEVLESGNNAAIRGNGDQLDLGSANPPNSRQIILEK